MGTAITFNSIRKAVTKLKSHSNRDTWIDTYNRMWTGQVGSLYGVNFMATDFDTAIPEWQTEFERRIK